jgi:hypothetical protein
MGALALTQTISRKVTDADVTTSSVTPLYQEHLISSETVVACQTEKFTMAANTGARVVFPTGYAGGTKFDVLITARYNTSETTKLLTLAVDAVAVKMVNVGAFQCDTSLTVATTGTAYSVQIEVTFVVR